ncbi:MAG: hypothetical protein J6A30_03395 [Ruminococcus sp.]|nr:hypothetical protein [Ruminococcus sp.]
MITRTGRRWIGIAITIVLILLFVMRVLYVNNIQYSITGRVVHQLQETFSFHNIQITASEYRIYSGEELSAMYDNQIKDYVDEKDLLFNLNLQNTTDEVQKLDLSSVCIQYDSISGGGLNPYLFPFFNNNESAYIVVDPGETKTVTMIFPYTACDTASLIFSLYPNNVRLLIF